MGGCRCCFRQCPVASYRNPGMHFFKFPIKDQTRFHQWCKLAGVPDFLNLTTSVLKNKVLCARHFPDSNFMNYKKNSLTRTAAPTLHRITEELALDFSNDENNPILIRIPPITSEHLKPPEGFPSKMHFITDDQKIANEVLKSIEEKGLPQLANQSDRFKNDGIQICKKAKLDIEMPTYDNVCNIEFVDNDEMKIPIPISNESNETIVIPNVNIIIEEIDERDGGGAITENTITNEKEIPVVLDKDLRNKPAAESAFYPSSSLVQLKNVGEKKTPEISNLKRVRFPLTSKLKNMQQQFKGCVESSIIHKWGSTETHQSMEFNDVPTQFENCSDSAQGFLKVQTEKLHHITTSSLATNMSDNEPPLTEERLNQPNEDSSLQMEKIFMQLIESEKTVSDLKAKLAAIKETNEKLKTQLDENIKQQSNLRGEVKKLKSSNDLLQKNYKNLQEDYIDLKKEKEQLTADSQKQKNLTKTQLFNGIKKYLSQTMIALLRIQLSSVSEEREWKPDERRLAIDLAGLGEKVYKYFTEEWLIRLPPLRQVKIWYTEEGGNQFEEDEILN